MSARWYCYRCDLGGDYAELVRGWEFCPTCGERLVGKAPAGKAPAERFAPPPLAVDLTRRPAQVIGNAEPTARSRWDAIAEEIAPAPPPADPRAAASTVVLPGPRVFLRVVGAAGETFMIPAIDCRITALGVLRDPWLGSDSAARRPTFADVAVRRTAEFAAVDFAGMVGSRVEIVTIDPSNRWRAGVFYVKSILVRQAGPGLTETVDLHLDGLESSILETST